MKFLGIDYGSKRVGLAISDEGGRLAFPKEIISNDANIFLRLAQIIEEEKIKGVVLGESLDHSNNPNAIASEADIFSKEFSQRFKLPVNKEKEFLTTVEARRHKNGVGIVDAAAAALILQRYLDKRNKE